MRGKVKCFKEELKKGVSFTVMDAGLRVVEVKAITGTVDKCGELDDHFQYTRRRDRQEESRRHRIAEALKKNVFFPPVDLNLYRGEYYVVDGNRRVSAAIQMCIAYIDANVTEYINRKNFIDMAGTLYRRRFEQETGIRAIVLSFENGFEFLRREAEGYRETGGPSVHGKSWYSQLFLPRCMKIEKSMLPAHYRNLRTGDIYVLIGEFYRNFMGGIPEHTDYDTIISGFLFAHGLPLRRRFRGQVYRLLTHVFMHRMRRI